MAAEGFPKGVECSLAFGCEMAEDEDGFGGDAIDNVTDFGVIEKQIDELCNFEVVYRNLRLVVGSNEQACLNCT